MLISRVMTVWESAEVAANRATRSYLLSSTLVIVKDSSKSWVSPWLAILQNNTLLASDCLEVIVVRTCATIWCFRRVVEEQCFGGE